VRAHHDGIQYEFSVDGVRYRPSVDTRPTEVFDEFLAHCEARMRRADLAAATVNGYRKVLDTAWRPQLGGLPFLTVPFSTLIKIADTHKSWGKKTYNNSVSALRRAFVFGYQNHPQLCNPVLGLKGIRLSPREQPRLLTPALRWRHTLKRLGLRYRKPYAARHTSVSWNLMIGKNPLYNARQHGHSVLTMWRVYSAWMPDAVDVDIEAFRRSMACARAPGPFGLKEGAMFGKLKGTISRGLQASRLALIRLCGAIGAWMRSAIATG
jgi:hypothetical protein